MTEHMTAADILEGAADVLVFHGWNKGRYHNDATGEYCAVGAMRRAHYGDLWRLFSLWNSSELVAALRALQTHLGLQPGGVPNWNDNKAKDADEVIEALRQTAKDLRNTGTVQ